MGIPAEIRKRLPKSKMFWMKLRRTVLYRPIRFAKFRNANAMFIWLGPLEIGWRMPWLDRSARQLHPHLFQDKRHDQ